MKVSGIYAIKNQVNGKVYIGQSVDIYTRWNNHKYSLNAGNHPNTHLQNAWEKYGADNFVFEVVCECKSSVIDDLEKKYISIYNSYKNGYNNDLGGHKGNRQFSDETKRKISKALLGKKQTPEHSKHNSESHKGIVNANKRIICVETGIEYESAREATRMLGINYKNISNVLRGHRPTCDGYHWEFAERS